MKALALPVLLLALVAAKDDPLAGRAPGAPARCIDPIRVTGPEITRAGTIIYRGSAKRLWVSTPIGTCPALRPYSTLVIDRFGVDLCRGDRFRVLDPPSRIASATCRFGPFVPWVKQ